LSVLDDTLLKGTRLAHALLARPISRQPTVQPDHAQEIAMIRKQATTKTPRNARQPRAVADSGRVRFGNGMSPIRVARSTDPATKDSGAVRFGNGMTPAGLLK